LARASLLELPAIHVNELRIFWAVNLIMIMVLKMHHVENTTVVKIFSLVQTNIHNYCLSVPILRYKYVYYVDLSLFLKEGLGVLSLTLLHMLFIFLRCGQK